MSIFLPRPGINAEVKVPFRWYSTPLLKNKNKRECRDLEATCGYRLLTPPNRLLSFEFYRDPSAATITSWTVYDTEGNLVETLDETLLTIVPITDTDDPCDYIVYAGQDLGTDFTNGYYYSVIEDSDGNEWYSEDFYVLCLGTQPNILENGDFSDGNLGWTLEEVTITDGQACFNTPSLLPRFMQHAVTVIQDVVYKVKIYVSNVVGSGSIVVTLGGGPPVSIVNPAEGMYVIDVTSSTSGIIDITMSSPMTACIDFIEVEAIADLGACNARLVWSNSCQFVGNIYYPEGYVNEFYLDTGVEPIAPVVNIIREYDENGNKEKILRRQRRETTYKLEVGAVPWYVADALVEMSLHNEIRLELANGLGTGNLKFVDVDIPWEDFGSNCLANCSITFQLDDATVTDGCCDGDIIPPIEICTELFCDPELNLMEAIITDFTYTDLDAIANGTSTNSAPIIGTGCSFTGQQLCTSTPLANDDIFIEFQKTIDVDEKYVLEFTIDSITGTLEIYRDGILGASYSAPGTYQIFLTPDTVITTMDILFQCNGAVEACITFDTMAIWVPCMVPLTSGWVGYEDGLIYSGGDGSGSIEATGVSSNYTYVIEIDYELPVGGDCFEVYINGELARTVTNGPDPSAGTVTFNFDPRDYNIPRNGDMPILIVPCDGDTSVIGLTGIRFCGLLY